LNLLPCKTCFSSLQTASSFATTQPQLRLL
jgi:hypothetical protein